jgi:hypothetical protein
MNNYSKFIIALLFLLSYGFSVNVLAQDYDVGKVSTNQTMYSDVVAATITGTNVCVGCSLKKEKGAGAQCSVYGHKHSLKVSKATDKDGNELSDMTGWLLYYLETDKSTELINGHHKEELVIEGKIYPDERVLEVISF